MSPSNENLLVTTYAKDFPRRTDRVWDEATLSAAADIISDVRTNGWEAVRRLALKFGERRAAEPLFLDAEALRAAWHQLDEGSQHLLRAVTERIKRFAQAQLSGVARVQCDVPGGAAGHRFVPIGRVGCYIPGGRYPLPSTALMTIVTARVAGCPHVVAASPHPHATVQAAAYIAGADALLCVGGAQAIAVMAYGASRTNETSTPFDQPCDMIVGPGNRWVTAAKKLVAGDVGIDMLAGPSELVVLADDHGDAEWIAADLLAQAEHDVDARPILITTSAALIDAVNRALAKQIANLPTAEVAAASLASSCALLCDSWDEAVDVVNRIAPEHLELHCANADQLSERFVTAGCLFIGSRAAEIFGDYGIGPNHTLPTGGTARFSSGLSVLSFLRLTTWLRLDEVPRELVQQTAMFARWEGLEAHARAAERRISDPR